MGPLFCVLLLLAAVPAFSSDEVDFLDRRHWSASLLGETRIAPFEQGIAQLEPGILAFQGFAALTVQERPRPQYTLSPELSRVFDNKLVQLSLKLEGRLRRWTISAGQGLNGSFHSYILVALRAGSGSSSSLDRDCFFMKIKNTYLEVSEFTTGTAFRYSYSSFPALGFVSFPTGEEVIVTFGVVPDGEGTRLIARINGVEMFNLSRRARVPNKPGSRLMLSLLGTNGVSKNDDPYHSKPGSRLVVTNLFAVDP